MNIPLMKYADEYIGRILCALLGRSKSQQACFPETANNILFMKFWGMGSIILTAPAVQAVRDKFPQARLNYLSFESNREVLTVIGNADNIITIKLTNPVTFFIDTINLIRSLRKTNFDLVYDFEFFTYYSALINRFIEPKFSTGFDNKKNKRGRLFTHTVEFNDHIHTRNNFLNLVSNGKSTSSKEFPKPAYNSIQANTTSPYIVINPNASKMAYERRLPAEYFVKLINALSADGKFKIILTGSPEEINYVSEIHNKLENKAEITNLTGKLSVNELFSLIAKSESLITNDSGPLHIATALNKPVIAFFGPESPVRYGPLSSKQLVFYRGLECSPCMSVSNSKTVNCIYSEPKCMTGFDVGEIIIKTKEFINSLKI